LIARSLLLCPLVCQGGEAWWLEMPLSVHGALMKRMTAGNQTEMASAIARLPEMINNYLSVPISINPYLNQRTNGASPSSVRKKRR